MAERDDRFWAGFFGIGPEVFQQPGVVVMEHAALAGYSGIWSFRRGDCVVVSAPPALVSELEGLLGGISARQLLEPDWWRSVLGDRIELVIGPAYQGCLEPSQFKPYADAAVELLQTDAAKPALAELEAAVSALAWDMSALRDVQAPIAVRRDAGRVVAACGYRSRAEDVGDPCVLVHPDFYGRGYGTAVVSAVVASALADGKLVLYQTVEQNRASVVIAERLGYRKYASYFAIRLK